TVLALVLLFGAYALVDGVLALYTALADRSAAQVRRGWLALEGVAGVLAAIRLRREIEGEWLMILSGALSIVFGVLAFLFPSAGALAVVWLIAAYAIAFGVVMVILAFRLRRYGAGTVTYGATSAST